MGNLERPLTWVLAIVLLGYLFIANCECGEGTTCTVNYEFNIGNEIDTKLEESISIDIKIEDESIDVDSIIDAVLEEIELDTETETVE